jgi:hypothetical protein
MHVAMAARRVPTVCTPLPPLALPTLPFRLARPAPLLIARLRPLAVTFDLSRSWCVLFVLGEFPSCRLRGQFGCPSGVMQMYCPVGEVLAQQLPLSLKYVSGIIFAEASFLLFGQP